MFLHHASMNIDSPRQLIAAIPHLVGFYPDESLVLVLLCEQQVVALARLNAAESHNLTELPAPLQTAVTANHQAYGFVALAYVDSVDVAKPLTSLAQRLAEVSQISVLDLLHVSSSSWRSLMCDDIDCCPAEGHALHNTTTDIDAEFVFAGSAPFESRERMEQALMPRDLGALVEQRDAAFAGIGEEPAGMTAETRSESVNALVTRIMDSRELTFPEMAQACAVLSWIRTRDGFLRKLFDQPELRPHTRSHLVSLTSCAPDHHRAPVATVLAGCAWLDGNGALARIALDCALDADASYSLARLLDMALTHGVPPHVWSDSLEAVSYDQCLQGAA